MAAITAKPVGRWCRVQCSWRNINCYCVCHLTTSATFIKCLMHQMMMDQNAERRAVICSLPTRPIIVDEFFTQSCRVWIFWLENSHLQSDTWTAKVRILCTMSCVCSHTSSSQKLNFITRKRREKKENISTAPMSDSIELSLSLAQCPMCGFVVILIQFESVASRLWTQEEERTNWIENWKWSIAIATEIWIVCLVLALSVIRCVHPCLGSYGLIGI
jgi:hypothetical protein